MPRKRMLWPNYFSSDQLAQLSLSTCHTYEGFWCFADDRGRMLHDPDQLWADVWLKRRRTDHVDIDQVEQHLDALVSNGQLCEYEVGGTRFLHVIAWDEHQKINHPTPSKLPPCEKHQGAEWAMWWRDDDTATDRWRQAEKAASQAGKGVTHLGLHEGLSEDYVRTADEAEKQPLPGEMDSLSDSRSPQVVTHSQCSSVQVSSVQAKGGGKVRQFVRPSQRQAGNQ